MLFMLTCLCACDAAPKLYPVSFAQFQQFVEATDYITDAEKFGWSFVQLNVFQFKVIEGANWRKPDGHHAPTSSDLPVTQVSYNDAIAYCRWAGARLPTYEEYWDLIQNDHRRVVTENSSPISPTHAVNILGNVWEITEPGSGDSTQLAGGSLFCSVHTCNGTVRERRLFVDKQTGNTHIGFGMVK